MHRNIYFGQNVRHKESDFLFTTFIFKVLRILAGIHGKIVVSVKIPC